MKKKLLLFIIIAFALSGKLTIAQNNNFSITHVELLKQRGLYSYPIEKWDSLRCAWYGECEAVAPSIKLPGANACSLDKRMLGWYVPGTSSNNYVWKSISDLSYFGYDINPSSGLDNSGTVASWATNSTIVAAHTNNVNINLCIILQDFSTSQTDFNTFFKNANGQQQILIDNAISAVIAANAKGINIDFEGFHAANYTPLVNFISLLSNQLHSKVPNSELSIDLQATYSISQNLISQLNSYVDLFVIMGYDYYWDGEGYPGPVAPLYQFPAASGDPNSHGSVSNDLNNFLKIVSPNKIILGMPYYGRRWGVNNDCTLPGIGSASTAIGVQQYYQFKDNLNGYYSSGHRDPHTFNAYYCFNDINGISNQEFIDDIYSYQKKYDVIKQRNIAGAAVWRLGFDAGYNDLWNLINNNLSECSIIPCSDTICDMGGPMGNYHNNEDYVFTIAPPNATSLSLNFLYFNTEPINDYLKIYNGPSTSSPLLVTLSGSTLPSTITASSGVMTIQFHSDGATNGGGYKAIYSCSSTSNGSPGSFTLSATPICSGTTPRIQLTWTASANATSYDIYRNNSLLTSGITTTTYLNTVGVGVTFNYYIKANNSSGSTNSNTTSATGPTTCSYPGNFTLSAIPGCSSNSPHIQLTWTASNNAATYDVYRNNSLYFTGLTGTSFDNTSNVAAGSTYSYYIKANNANGSTSSNSINATALTNCNTLPGSFTLTAAPICSGTTPRIQLTWTTSINATSYDLYRNNSLLASGITTTTYLNTVGAGISFSYYIKANNSSGSTNSNTTSATGPSNCQSLTLSATPSCNGSSPQILLSWNAVSGASSYSLYRNGTLYGSGITGTTYNNTSVVSGTSYSYYLVAIVASGNLTSNTLSSTAPTCQSLTLSATPSCSGSSPQILLSWNAVSGASSYSLYRNGTLYGSGITGTTYNNTSVVSGTSYSYYLVAIVASGNLTSNTLSSTAPTCQSLTLSATPSCNGSSPQILLSWNAVSGASSYSLYRNGTLYGSGITGTTYNNTSVVSGTSYSYYLVAVVASGNLTSNTLSSTAPTCQSLTLSATPSCSGSSPQILLSWNAVSGASSYSLYRNGTLYGSGITGTTYNNTSVVSGTSYSYYLVAVVASGNLTSNTLSSTAPTCQSLTLSATPSCSGSSPQILLSWNAVSGASSYSLYRNGTLYGSGITGTTYNNTSVVSGTSYSYYLVAVVASGNLTSNTLSSTAPTCQSLTLTATPSCSGSSPQILLSWNAVSGASSYSLYRNGTLYGSGITGTTYNNTSVVSGTSYSYYLVAVVASGNLTSNTLSSTAPTCQSLTLSATPSCSGSNPQILLSWNAVSGASSYSLYRNGTLYGSGITGTTYNNTSVVSGTSYSYYLVAVVASGNLTSNTLSSTAPTCQSLTLSATPSCSGSSPQILLSWNAVNGASSYSLYRNGTLYGSGITGTTYNNTSVVSGTSYSYYLVAIVASGNLTSNTLSSTAPSNCCTSPGSFGLGTSAACSSSSPIIYLAWTTSSGATSYSLYRNGTIYASGLTALAYQNTANLIAGTTYTYYVKAISSCGSTINSNSVNATVPFCRFEDSSLMNAQSEPNAIIFPNPNSGNFTLSLSNPEEQFVNVKIVNMLGQVTKSIDLGITSKESSTIINAIDLSTDIYIIEIMIGDKRIMRKLMVEH